MLRTIITTALVGLLMVLAASDSTAQANDFDCDVDEQQVRIRYSLYFEHYRAGNHEAALGDLEWILACAPGFGGRTEDDRNFRRAVEVHEELAKQATDPAERRAHLDTALKLIDSAVPTLQDAGVEVSEHAWLIARGRFLQSHELVLGDRQGEVCEAYSQAFELDPDETDDFYLQVIAFCRAEEAVAGDANERREARTFLEETLLAGAEDGDVRDYIQTQADRLITTPREQFAFLYERYRDVGLEGMSDDDIEQLFTLNQQAGEQFFSGPEQAQDLRRELLPVVAELSPSYSRFTSLGTAELAARNFEQANAFFERAMELASTPNERRDTHYNMAVVRQQQNQFASAANRLREALAIDSNHGPSLYLMGSLIQGSVRGTDIHSRAAYWCAADFFNRAAAQGVANASAAAAGALRGAPSRDDYFFQGWRPGQTVSASYGWGSCQARVR